MICQFPFVKDGKAYGCGQCMPCRVNHRRVWTHRIILETALRKDNAFVTLTYSEENVPRSYMSEYADKQLEEAKATLVPKHPQDWLKRLRKAFVRPLRYYLVGEYGSETHRPHYHAMLFGYPRCLDIRNTQYNSDGSVKCCAFCSLLQDTWSLGRVHSGDVNMSSAGYIAGYVTKKMTAKDDARLFGRHPEFARMSLRPGIGADMMDEVASELMTFNLDVSQADVPSALRHGRRELPLGRYLTRRLRARVGKDEAAPKAVLDQIAEELRPLRESAFDASRSFSAEVAKAGEGKRINLEGRQAIFKKRDRL